MRALMTDYGGVLSFPHGANEVARMAERLGVSFDEFMRAYVVDRHDLDAGALAVEDYWRRLLDHLSRAHLASSELVAALVEDDMASWSIMRQAAWDVVAAFHGRGGRTALLTNNIPPLMARLRASGRLVDFDVVMASCEMGICK